MFMNISFVVCCLICLGALIGVGVSSYRANKEDDKEKENKK